MNSRISNRKKVCIVTTSRSDYGLLRWVIDGVCKEQCLVLQLIVTGGHLLREQGLTYKLIEKDGFHIDVKLRASSSADNTVEIAKSMGKYCIGITDAITKLKPDLIVVLGDRYELVSIVSSAVIMGVPVAHICGGDITKGALDNEFRNAITMMSSLHFPDTFQSYKNVIRMRDCSDNVFCVGDTSIDNFFRTNFLSRKDLGDQYSLDICKKWVLMTYHPETKISLLQNERCALNIIKCLLRFSDLQIVITGSNLDYGGSQLNALWRKAVAKYPDSFKFILSMGQINYLSFMKESSLVIGNSSSGIVETTFWGIPTVNIGTRQLGRHLCKNVMQVGRSFNEIFRVVNLALNQKQIRSYYYGDGHSSIRIVEHIKKFLYE